MSFHLLQREYQIEEVLYHAYMEHGDDSAQYQGMIGEWRDSVSECVIDEWVCELCFLCLSVLQTNSAWTWKKVGVENAAMGRQLA